MLKLSKTQEKLACQKKIGPSVIKGAEQSGKTAVAISRMIYLLENDCQAHDRVLFVCTNEVKRQKELASVKSGADERNKKRYYAFKRKYSMISKLNEATNNILKVIDSLSNNYEVSSERVKVKS